MKWEVMTGDSEKAKISKLQNEVQHYSISGAKPCFSLYLASWLDQLPEQVSEHLGKPNPRSLGSEHTRRTLFGHQGAKRHIDVKTEKTESMNAECARAL